MLRGGQSVEFPSVARGVSQHEVVAEIDRVARPRDEMIHVLGFLLERPMAVEARARLELPDDGSYDLQIGAFTAEQEFIKIGLLRQPVGVESPDILRPSAFDQIDDE